MKNPRRYFGGGCTVWRFGGLYAYGQNESYHFLTGCTSVFATAAVVRAFTCITATCVTCACVSIVLAIAACIAGAFVRNPCTSLMTNPTMETTAPGSPPNCGAASAVRQLPTLA